jgi:Putative adhesin
MKSIALLTSLLILAGAARASVTETFTQSYPLAPDGIIHLENVNGDIDITAWDKPGVSLVAEKRAKNDEELKRLEIVIDAQPARLSIKTKYAKKGGWSFFGNSNQGSVHYTLMVPAGVQLDKIDAVNSDITVTNVHGTVNLDTVNGRIEARGLMANAWLDSVNGSLTVQFASLVKVQEVKLESVNGRAEIILPKDAGAHLEADTVNGNIIVEQSIRLSKSGRSSLRGDIGSGSARINLDTVNGSILVKER